jgi:hypothetical protein
MLITGCSWLGSRINSAGAMLPYPAATSDLRPEVSDDKNSLSLAIRIAGSCDSKSRISEYALARW